MSNGEDKLDVIIVGAGPAGSAAALVLAREGLSVGVLERGEYPGAKNLFGGVLYTTVLEQLVPGFRESAPLERHIHRRRYVMLGDGDQLAFEFASGHFDQAPFNHSYSVLRAKFDAWFATQAEEAGAMLLPATAVEELIVRDGRVVGVRTGRDDGDLLADVVIVAEGCNSFLARKAGFRRDFQPHRLQLAVKEVIALDRGVIEQRFNIEGGQGCSVEYFGGEAVAGMFGGAFIYTNGDSLSVGVSCAASEFPDRRMLPNAVLEHFKGLPFVRPLLAGGQTLEYSGHMIPEFGPETMPRIYGEGVLFAGDCAGLVNLSPFYHEGTNLAMASGQAAAETVLELRKAGRPFTAANMARYEQRLRKSWVCQDVERYRGIPDFGHRNPQFFNKYPYVFGSLARDFFSVDHRSKKQVEKDVIRRFRKEVGLWRFIRDGWKAFKALR
ncbi:MAG: Electron transfer flavoprotein-ubiquinone oxidoreductase [Phycisphaerae bacterium]|nr:Electron transfer flavoprotein-ubiquinone oxidoreductase [Phycisphaerae bacterium]